MKAMHFNSIGWVATRLEATYPDDPIRAKLYGFHVTVEEQPPTIDCGLADHPPSTWSWCVYSIQTSTNVACGFRCESRVAAQAEAVAALEEAARKR